MYADGDDDEYGTCEKWVSNLIRSLNVKKVWQNNVFSER